MGTSRRVRCLARPQPGQGQRGTLVLAVRLGCTRAPRLFALDVELRIVQSPVYIGLPQCFVLIDEVPRDCLSVFPGRSAATGIHRCVRVPYASHAARRARRARQQRVITRQILVPAGQVVAPRQRDPPVRWHRRGPRKPEPSPVDRRMEPGNRTVGWENYAPSPPRAAAAQPPARSLAAPGGQRTSLFWSCRRVAPFTPAPPPPPAAPSGAPP